MKWERVVTRRDALTSLNEGGDAWRVYCERVFQLNDDGVITDRTADSLLECAHAVGRSAFDHATHAADAARVDAR